MNVLRNYPLTIVCVLTVWYLSLFKPPSVSLLDGVDGVDKVVHALMYAGLCSLLWLEWFRRNHRRGAWRRMVAFAVGAPILMSGLLELLQEYCTSARSGEWADLLANSLGTLLAAVGAWVYEHVCLR